MTEIIGAINSPGPSIPAELSSKIEIRATHALTDHEAFLFTVALNGIVNQMKKENINFSDLYRATVLCTKDGEVKIVEDDAIGYYLRLIVFCVQRWRDCGWSDLHILAAYIEELCHHYWHISDEELVKIKVVEIINSTIKEEVSFEQIYSTDWKLAYPDIYGTDIKLNN